MIESLWFRSEVAHCDTKQSWNKLTNEVELLQTALKTGYTILERVATAINWNSRTLRCEVERLSCQILFQMQNEFDKDKSIALKSIVIIYLVN